ncbi:MAG: Formyl transferase [Candidatus Poribacteria bacterium]|nr:Formyl transferase [Candidatus Poribacteria bacterium]
MTVEIDRSIGYNITLEILNMLDIGWFSSGRDQAAIDLLKVVSDAIKSGSIQGKISFVFVTREKGEKPESDKFIDYAEKLVLEVMALSHRNFEPQLRKAGLEESIRLGSDSPILENWRKQYDDVVMAKLSYYKPDMIVLAGYMLIVSAEMCRKYNMINLHPALPGGPKGTWQEVIWQLMEQKAKKTGVMMHLITPELDAGPAITYCEYDIYDHIKPLWKQWEIKRKSKALQEIQKNDGENEPLFSEIRRLGLKREFPLIVATLKSASVGEFSILNGEVLSNGQKLVHGFDLTNEVERSI